MDGLASLMEYWLLAELDQTTHVIPVFEPLFYTSIPVHLKFSNCTPYFGSFATEDKTSTQSNNLTDMWS